MKKCKVVAVALVLCLTLVLSACAGLGGKKKTVDENTITYWMPLTDTQKIDILDYSDSPIGKKIEEATGINVSYVHPDNEEQFNLALASGDLPDVVEYFWIEYPGGPEKAIEEKQIITFDHLMEEYAPNLTKYLKEHPEVDKVVTTSDGKHYLFPFVRGDEYLLISNGPLVRKDWLDDLGIAMPETMDDWYNMLKRFKAEKTGGAAPLVTTLPLENGVFSAAYGAPKTFFLSDGKIQYGPILDGYKECLMEMNKWYKEGLLDPNFMGLDGTMLDSAILNGKAGATVGSVGSGIGKWMAAASEEGYDLTAVRYPVLNRGEKAMFTVRQYPANGYGAAITTNCKNPELAMRLLDYAYSEEGHMLMNFGIEGESYDMIDGYPTYTEMVANNPEGKSMVEVLGNYARSMNVGPFIQDRRYMEQYAALPQQKSAIEIWSESDAEGSILPPLAPPADESKELASILNDVKTFVNEYTVKFITGDISFDQWDMFVNQIKKFNIDRAIEIYQTAYDKL